MSVLSLLDIYRNKDIDSHFRLVIISVQRAKRLLQGSPRLSELPFAKETSRAIDEVINGQVDFVVGTEARLVREANQHVAESLAEIQLPTTEATPATPAPTETPAATT